MDWNFWERPVQNKGDNTNNCNYKKRKEKLLWPLLEQLSGAVGQGPPWEPPNDKVRFVEKQLELFPP